MRTTGRVHEWINTLHHDPSRGWWFAMGLFPTYPASIVYEAIVRLRSFLYRVGVLRSERVGGVVVCVGNITTGGSGKTPAVIHIAGKLRDMGVKTAVISRGYGFRVRGDYLVVSGPEGARLGPGEGPDEALMTAYRLPGVPVVVSPRRVRAAEAAHELFGAQVIVMDDGYQHRALFRDINVLVMDAADPVGNGFILPAGPLREPPSAVRRADILWLVGEGGVPWCIRRYVPGIPVVRASYVPDGLMTKSAGTIPLEKLAGRRVMAFAGIARPGRFFETVGSVGAVLAGRAAFPDHHRYDAADVRDLNDRAAASGAELFVTTEKDLARIGADAPFAHEVLAVTMGISAVGDDRLFQMIGEKRKGKAA
jgi:tetraacyldisaccharide 4'-kinase